MSTPSIDYDALAAQHGGTAIDYDAIAAQHGGTAVAATPKADFSSLTANPKGEGTYKVTTHDGQTLNVPYSNVPVFTQNLQGANFASPDEEARFIRDATADPKRPTFWNALTNPVGAGGREQGLLGGALQVGGQAIKSMVQPVAHPINTLESLYNTVRHPVNTAEGIANQVKSDYAQGGVPFAAENLGGQVLGGVEGGRIMAAAAQPAVEAAGRGAAQLAPKLYQSALKPSTTLSQAERTNITQTALQNNIPVSENGLDSINTHISNLNNAIKDQIAADPARQISPNLALQRLQESRARFANQVNPGSDLAAFDNAQQEFTDQLRSTPGTEGPLRALTADEAQAMKQGTYRALGNKSYGELKGATVEAQKSLARGLKDEIANQFPEINNLNAQESKMFDLQPVLERAVNRISNHQLIGIGTPIAGGAVEALTHSGAAGMAAAALKMAIDNPMVKSRLAIVLSKGANIPYAQAVSRIGAYSTALGSSAGAAQGSSGGPTANQ